MLLPHSGSTEIMYAGIKPKGQTSITERPESFMCPSHSVWVPLQCIFKEITGTLQLPPCFTSPINWLDANGLFVGCGES